MVIKLDPQKEARLQEIAKARGNSLEEVVESAIDRVIREEERPCSDDDVISDEKHTAMMAGSTASAIYHGRVQTTASVHKITIKLSTGSIGDTRSQ